MAELINAFKTKYTGEQIEKIFETMEKIEIPETGSTLNTKIKYRMANTSSYESDDVKISLFKLKSKGSVGGNVGMMMTGYYLISDSSGAHLTIENYTSIVPENAFSTGFQYQFKNGPVIPKVLHMNLLGNSESTIIRVEYYIDGQWVNVQETSYDNIVANIDWQLELPQISTSYFRLTTAGLNNNYSYLRIRDMWVDYQL
jgi:hypothetical protein